MVGLFLALGLAAGPVCERPNVAEAERRAEAVSVAADWLIGQIHEDTHLLRSYDNPAEFNSWTYDQAVGAIGLLSTGHNAEAGEVLDAMLGILAESQASPAGMAAFADGYQWDTKSEILGAGTRATGPNAWMGLAFLHAYRELGDPRYLEAARDVANWLIDNLRVGQGDLGPAFLGGFDPDTGELLQWISTEHNSDMLAFLRGLQAARATPLHPAGDWGALADELESWMQEPLAEGGLWDEAKSHFAVGYEEIDPPRVSGFNEVLDSQTWTVLAFDASGRVTRRPIRRDRIGLRWLDERWRVSVECGGEERSGFSKRTFEPGDPDSPVVSFWNEGMGGYALARLYAPRFPRIGRWLGRKVIRDLRCFQRDDGGVPYSVGETIDLSDHFEGNPPFSEYPIAVFSSFTNILGGEPGVFGDAQPDWDHKHCRVVSWFYPLAELGPDPFQGETVRSPHQSFALVNDSDRSVPCPGETGGGWDPYEWASFTLTLNPRNGSGESAGPRDISGFEELRFWARAQEPGVRIKVSLNIGSYQFFWSKAHSVDHTGWEQIRLPLASFSPTVLTQVHSLGISFGNEVNGVPLNEDEDTLWVDDFSFYPTSQEMPELKVFPDNWQWESVAATAWFVFAQQERNPFAVAPRRRARP
jgi:hypothetical protein